MSKHAKSILTDISTVAIRADWQNIDGKRTHALRWPHSIHSSNWTVVTVVSAIFANHIRREIKAKTRRNVKRESDIEQIVLETSIDSTPSSQFYNKVFYPHTKHPLRKCFSSAFVKSCVFSTFHLKSPVHSVYALPVFRCIPSTQHANIYNPISNVTSDRISFVRIKHTDTSLVQTETS